MTDREENPLNAARGIMVSLMITVAVVLVALAVYTML